MTLKDEIEGIMRAELQGTVFGLTGWAEGAEGVKSLADRLDIAAWGEADRQFIYALIEGNVKAITRLAEEIEASK
jgi:hypothetical protein